MICLTSYEKRKHVRRFTFIMAKAIVEAELQPTPTPKLKRR